jgi:glycosyltransferase involved in cell wall biosynthesis
VTADPVTVAVPVLNGGPLFEQVLEAVASQRVDRPVELLVADSGSSDGSRALAQAAGARIIDVTANRFSHGATRNRLASEARGSHVAFLTQDSVPADERWLARLLEGFALADDVALVFGPYRARPDASLSVRRELDAFFTGFSPDGRPRVDRAGSPDEGSGLGRRPFFTDANGCVARAAWQQVPFRDVPYAEDQVLAHDMLTAGYAKAYHPAAVVIHSHDYPPLTLFRRCFDEWRALREVHGHVAPAGPVRVGLVVQRAVRDDVELMAAERRSPPMLVLGAAGALRHHAIRAAGAALGSRAERLPPWLRRRCSLEGRP